MDRSKQPLSTAKWVARKFDAHHRFVISCLAAALAAIGLQGHVTFTTELVSVWAVFACTTLLTIWFVLWTDDPYEVRRNARLQDSSQTLLFIVVISAAIVSLFAVFILLGSSKNSSGHFAAHIALSFATIVLSWMLVHTLFTLRYAHLYYFDARKKDRKDIEDSLIFPGNESPDYLDFAYFSFVIGMTCQVSDVQIASKPIRRLATIHGLIAFAFNTSILAMFVNIIAGVI